MCGILTIGYCKYVVVAELYVIADLYEYFRRNARAVVSIGLFYATFTETKG